MTKLFERNALYQEWDDYQLAFVPSLKSIWFDTNNQFNRHTCTSVLPVLTGGSLHHIPSVLAT